MSNWYYAQDSQQQGPINEAELIEMIATEKLPGTVLVWQDGMANWAMANTLPQFQFRPPPIPSAPRIPTVAAAPAVAATVQAQPTQQAQSPADPETGEAPLAPLDPEDVAKNKPFAILAYLGILFIVPMIAAKDSPFAKYHANQGLILFIVWLVAMIATTIIGSIPVVGLISFLLWPLTWAACLILTVIGILNAAKGETKPLPYIGNYTIYS